MPRSARQAPLCRQHEFSISVSQIYEGAYYVFQFQLLNIESCNAILTTVYSNNTILCTGFFDTPILTISATHRFSITLFQSFQARAVYVMSNRSDVNTIVAFGRRSDGKLSRSRSVSIKSVIVLRILLASNININCQDDGTKQTDFRTGSCSMHCVP